MATIASLSRVTSAAASVSAADVVRHDDTRMSDARTPTAHAASHHGGSDPVTPAGIGAQPVDADLTTIAGLTATTDNVIQSVGSAWASRTPAQVKTALALNLVDNTADTAKPVSTAQQTALNLKQDLSGKDVANGYCGLDSSALIPRARYYLATTTLDGTIRLAGDLAGTGTSPTVPGLAAKENTSAKGAASGYASLDGSTKVPIAQLPTGTSATTVTIGNDARLTDARTPSGTAGGALNGTYPNPSLDVVPHPPVALTDAATIATDASLGNHFRVTLGASRTLGNPTNLTDGQRLTWEVIQDATGSRALTFDTMFAFGSQLASITLTTTAGKRDFIGGIYHSITGLIYIVAFAPGY